MSLGCSLIPGVRTYLVSRWHGRYDVHQRSCGISHIAVIQPLVPGRQPSVARRDGSRDLAALAPGR
eukprot:2706694-Alexandrium_andersonii.AAC.1